MFTSEKPKVNHLRIFGFLVYLHIPNEKRSKLEPSGKKGIFFGYNNHPKSYQIYIPSFRQIEINKNVTIDEYVAFNKSKKNYAYEEHEEEK